VKMASKARQQPQQQEPKQDEFAKAQKLFDSLKEPNGNVLTSKLSDYLKKQGMDDDWVAKALQQIDVNGDNELTWAEFGTKGIKLVHQLKLHADHVARESAKKPAAEKAAPEKASPLPHHHEVDVPADVASYSKASSSKAATPSGPPPSPSSSASSPKAAAPKRAKSSSKAASPSKKDASSNPYTSPVVVIGLPASALVDLIPAPNPRTRNLNLIHRVRQQQETAKLIKDTQAKAEAGGKKGEKRKKKFPPKKPTKDEKGILNRLRKHDATKAPAYEKTLNDKYSIKKKAAPVIEKKKK